MENTIIDLNVVGAPDNDTEAWECYISEKGIQSLPKAIDPWESPYGDYKCSFIVNGTLYHGFKNRIMDERKGMVSFTVNSNTNSTYIVPDRLFEDIQSISYMTLTNNRIRLQGNIILNAKNNVITVFNNGVFALVDESSDMLAFIYRTPLSMQIPGAEAEPIKTPVRVYYAAYTVDADSAGDLNNGMYAQLEWPRQPYSAANKGIENTRQLIVQDALIIADKDDKVQFAAYQANWPIWGAGGFGVANNPPYLNVISSVTSALGYGSSLAYSDRFTTGGTRFDFGTSYWFDRITATDASTVFCTGYYKNSDGTRVTLGSDIDDIITGIENNFSATSWPSYNVFMNHPAKVFNDPSLYSYQEVPNEYLSIWNMFQSWYNNSQNWTEVLSVTFSQGSLNGMQAIEFTLYKSSYSTAVNAFKAFLKNALEKRNPTVNFYMYRCTNSYVDSHGYFDTTDNYITYTFYNGRIVADPATKPSSAYAANPVYSDFVNESDFSFTDIGTPPYVTPSDNGTIMGSSVVTSGSGALQNKITSVINKIWNNSTLQYATVNGYVSDELATVNDAVNDGQLFDGDPTWGSAAHPTGSGRVFNGTKYSVREPIISGLRPGIYDWPGTFYEAMLNVLLWSRYGRGETNSTVNSWSVRRNLGEVPTTPTYYAYPMNLVAGELRFNLSEGSTLERLYSPLKPHAILNRLFFMLNSIADTGYLSYNNPNTAFSIRNASTKSDMGSASYTFTPSVVNSAGTYETMGMMSLSALQRMFFRASNGQTMPLLDNWNMSTDGVSFSGSAAQDRNSVFYTGIGTYELLNAGTEFIKPTNISDDVVGIYGTQRDVNIIKSKSIEQWQIADTLESPVNWVKLHSQYDSLVSWGALSGKLNILTFDKGDFYLNGKNYVRRDLFDDSSIFLSASVIKGQWHDVIKTGKIILLVNKEGQIFRTTADGYIFPISTIFMGDFYTNLKGNMWNVEIENLNPFAVGFVHRNPSNELINSMIIATDQYNSDHSETKREFRVWKNDMSYYDILATSAMPMFDRVSGQENVIFYKLGRDSMPHLVAECQGYLKGIAVVDTKYLQKANV